MDISSVNSDLIRGNVTTIILGCLFENDKYGYEILKEIEEKSTGQYELKQATLYNQLKRLEKQGLVSSYDGDPDNTGGGQRRYYSLTPEGRIYLRRERREYEYSRTILDKLVSAKPFDFTKPLPFDASDLRPYTKREPGEKIQYKDKIVEVEKLIYVDFAGNRITEDEAKMLAAQAEMDKQTALSAEKELTALKALLLQNEETRMSYLEQMNVLRERIESGELSPEAQKNVDMLKQMLRESEQDRIALRLKLSEQSVQYDDIALRNDEKISALSAQLMRNEELCTSYLEQIAALRDKMNDSEPSEEVKRKIDALQGKLNDAREEVFDLNNRLNEQAELAARLEKSEEERQKLTEQILNLMLTSEVEKQAQENKIKSLNEEINRLNEAAHDADVAALGIAQNLVDKHDQEKADEYAKREEELRQKSEELDAYADMLTKKEQDLNQAKVMPSDDEIKAAKREQYLAEEAQMSYREQMELLKSAPAVVVEKDNAELAEKLAKSEAERAGLTEKLLNQMLSSDSERLEMRLRISQLEREAKEREETSASMSAKAQTEYSESLAAARRQQYLSEEKLMSVQEYINSSAVKERLATDPNALQKLEYNIRKSEAERLKLSEELIEQIRTGNRDKSELLKRVSDLEAENAMYKQQYDNLVDSSRAQAERRATINEVFDKYEAQFDENNKKAKTEPVVDEQPEEVVTLQPIDHEQETLSSMRKLFNNNSDDVDTQPAPQQQTVEIAEAASDVQPSATINRPDSFAYQNDGGDYHDFFFGLAEQNVQKPAQDKPRPIFDDAPDIKTRLYQQGFKLRQYERNNSAEYYSFNFILSNRINRDTFLIVLALFVVEVAIMWLSLSTRVSYKYFLPILLVGCALCLIPTVMWLINPLKRKRANFNFKLSILNRLMLFIELSVICVLIGFFALGASVNDIDLIICSIVLPSVILLDLPISSVIYYLLYKTHKYHIA